VRCLSFIYSAGRPTAQAFYPPPHLPKGNSGGFPVSVVYMNLQPLVSTARTVSRRLVVSYTTFSPLPRTGSSFILKLD